MRRCVEARREEKRGGGGGGGGGRGGGRTGRLKESGQSLQQSLSKMAHHEVDMNT